MSADIIRKGKGRKKIKNINKEPITSISSGSLNKMTTTQITEQNYIDIAKIIDRVYKEIKTFFPSDSTIIIIAPVYRNNKGSLLDLFNLLKRVFSNHVLIDNIEYDLNGIENIVLPKRFREVAIIVDRIKLNEDIELRLKEDILHAFGFSMGSLLVKDKNSGLVYNYKVGQDVKNKLDLSSKTLKTMDIIKTLRNKYNLKSEELIDYSVMLVKYFDDLKDSEKVIKIEDSQSVYPKFYELKLKLQQIKNGE